MPAGTKLPLTPEYQAIFQANLANQAVGKQGMDPTYTCLSPGMPRIMNMYEPMEILITPNTTYILTQHIHDYRRIFTDGRKLPADVEPTFAGYAIGKWLDTDGDGKFDTLEIETRGMRGPRAFDATGMPLHADNKTIVKERIYLDKSNPNVMLNDITTYDSSLTKPWAITKRYGRNPTEKFAWPEENCAEGNGHVEIQGQGYFLSGDGNSDAYGYCHSTVRYPNDNSKPKCESWAWTGA